MSDTRTQRIAKNTAVLYVRMLFLMLIQLYTSRVILEALGIEDYGIYNVVGGFVAMFSIISSSLSGSASRFLNYEMGKGSKQNLNSVFCTTVSIQILLAIVIAVLSECVGVWYINNVMVLSPDRISAASWCFHFSVATFCISLLAVPYNAAITAHERMKAFAYVSIFEGLAKLLVCYLIMISPIDKLISYSFLLLCISIIVRLSYQTYCIRNFDECKYHWLLDRKYLRKILSYSTWHLFGNSSVILKDHGVNLIINLFFGPSVNAARGISTQVLHAVKVLASNFMTAIRPQITQSYARGDISYMFKLVYKGATFSYLVVLLISLPILLNTEYLLNIWLKETPQYAVIFAQLAIITALIDTMSRSLIYAQDATGNIRNYQIIVGGILLLNLPISYLFLWLGYSPVTVMYVSIGVETGALIARMVMIPHYIPDFHPADYCMKVIGKCLFITLVAAAFPLFLKLSLSDSLISFIVVTSFCIVCTIASIYYIGCNRHERTLIISKIGKVLNR